MNNPFTENAIFNTVSLEEAVKIAITALDEIVDENADRLTEELFIYKENAAKYRNLGLGVFGYANMLMALGITYGSKRALDLTDFIFNIMFKAAVEQSSSLANEKGCFPGYEKKIWDSEIIKNHFNKKEIESLRKKGLRNCSLLSIAPTGSIGTMFGRSGGIEPEFALSYKRRTDNLNESYDIAAKTLQDYFDITNDMNIPSFFIESKDIKWQDRIDTQSTIQKHIDTAISSTINLPQETSKEDIEKLYLYAWENKLKGITCFRSGCKREGILINSEENKKKINLKRGEISLISNDLVGLKRTLVTGCGTLHCQAFFDPNTGELQETYFSKGSTGGCNNFMIGLSRMISLAVRAGAPLERVIDQLDSCGVCPSYATRSAMKKDTSKGSCCPMAIGNALKDMHKEFVKYFLENQEFEEKKEKIVKNLIVEVKEKTKKPLCPNCGVELIQSGGCISCKSCGWDKCE